MAVTGWLRSTPALANTASKNARDHDDVIKWKHFPRYWPFLRGIHRSPVNSPHKGQWGGALTFSFFDLHLNKRLTKQSWSWWFETPPCPLWRHCNAVISTTVCSTCVRSRRSWWRHDIETGLGHCWPFGFPFRVSDVEFEVYFMLTWTSHWTNRWIVGDLMSHQQYFSNTDPLKIGLSYKDHRWITLTNMDL